MIGPEAGEVMAVVEIAMLAGLPYTALRDAILTHPTMAEGLNSLFTSPKQTNALVMGHRLVATQLVGAVGSPLVLTKSTLIRMDDDSPQKGCVNTNACIRRVEPMCPRGREISCRIQLPSGGESEKHAVFLEKVRLAAVAMDRQ